MADVVISGVEKIYPDGTCAVRDLNMSVDDGELVVLVGPSGCGKTTVLRMVAGLEEISAGTISIGERVVNDLVPKERDTAMVFQSYALYPHMSVFDNIAFPLRLMGVRKAEREQKVLSVAKTLGLEKHLSRKPRQLSGGQRQRVAMGRAIVREPKAFLMDEPLSNLDAKLRVQMRTELASLQRELGVTTIYVTHDQVEAMTLGDRVAVMRGGELQQFAAPQQIYDRPANMFVSAFIGSPPMNLIEADVTEKGDAIVIGGQRIEISETEAGGLRSNGGRSVVAGVRPEHISDAAVADAGTRRLRGVVSEREALGSDTLVHVRLDGARRLPRAVRERAHDVEDVTELDELAEDDAAIFVARFEPTTRIDIGDAVGLALQADSLQFFDRETGDVI